MAEEKNKINSLTELLKQRNGFVSIREAIELLGPEEYSSCLVDLVTKDEGVVWSGCFSSANRPTGS